MKKIFTFSLISAAFMLQAFSVSAMSPDSMMILESSKSEMVQQAFDILFDEARTQEDKQDLGLAKNSKKIEGLMEGSDQVLRIQATESEFKDYIKKSNYKLKGDSYYRASDSSYMTYQDNQIIISAKLPSSLETSSAMQKLLNKRDKNSFFSFLSTDVSQLTSFYLPEAQIQSFLLDLTESNNLFGIKAYTELSQSSTLNYNELTFAPEIYKKVATKDLLFFTEFKDIISRVQDAMGSDYTEVESEAPNLLSLFDGNSAFFITATNEEGTLPKFTLVTDIESGSILKGAIQEIADTIGDSEDFSYGEDNFKFGFQEDSMDIVISGTKIGKYFLITNDTEIAGDFDSGKSTLSSKFSTKSNTLSIFYADPAKLTRLKRLAPNEEELHDVIDIVAKIKEITGYSNALSATEQESKVSFTFDWKSTISKLRELVKEQFKAPFQDVSESDWFYEDVDSLSSSGVINSSNNNYRPGDTITRAEYITMVLRDSGYENYSPSNKGEQPFSDINGTEWYANYIATAYEIGLIKGDSNSSTVRPNDPINRAEAVKILDAALSQYPVTGEILPLPFVDVEVGEWYYLSLQKAHQLGLVNGTTAITFEPIRNLNRAEAAAMINRITDIK